MIEHRLIERIVPVLEKEINNLEAGGEPNRVFLARVRDFFHYYADMVHHGKEEKILFARMKKKELRPEDEQLMDELMNEHKLARETVGRLVKASEAGDKEEVVSKLKVLAELYPAHIEKEDKRMFPASMDYFSEAEQELMLKEGKDLDKGVVHKEYEEEMAGWEKRA